MRSYAIEDVGYVELEPSMHAHIYNVVGIVIEEEYQNLGVGTMLMKLVCHDADKQGIQLWLVPQALNADRQKSLDRFYTKLGFAYQSRTWESAELRGGYMIRMPN